MMLSSLIQGTRSLLLGLLVVFPLGLQAEDHPPAFPAIDAPRLGPTRTTTAPASLKIGHANLTFQGAWAPLMRGDKTVGLYLQGQGEITYTSTFEPEWPVVALNLKAWSSEKAKPFEQNHSVLIPFREARIFLAGQPIPILGGAERDSLEETHALFDQRWRRVDGHVPAMLLAMQEMNAPGKSVAIIEIEEGAQKWLYTFDGVDSMEESLMFSVPFHSSATELKGWEYLVGLSRQYIGWDPRKGLAPTHFLLSGLDVDLRTRDNREAEVVVQETIVPFEEGLQVFQFNLWTNLVLEKDTRHLKVRRITDGEGRALAFKHSHDKLAVQLVAPAQKGVPFSLRFEYGGDFLIRPESDSYWQLGVRAAWYPTPDNLASESYLLHGTVRTIGDWIAFLPGDTVRREKDGDWNLVETRTTKPVCFTTILGGMYFLDEETQDGLTVRIATYAFKPGQANKVFKAQAFNIIKYYQNFLGPFPFKEFLIIEKNAWGYGQAPAGMMYITRDAFEQAETVRDWEALAEMYNEYNRRGGNARFSVRTMDVRHVFAHEIAHQYWGTVVKMPSFGEQWITESFADFCAALYDGDYKGKNRFEKNVSLWRSYASDSTGKAPIPLANEAAEKDSRDRFMTRRNLLYAKGPVLLNTLYQELGDRVFLTWLKSIQANFRWKFATTKQMFDLLAFITKKDYSGFYNTYYWGLDLPGKKP
jgi:hypothetical protein